MFEQFFGNNQQKQMLESEKRQMDFAERQNVFSVTAPTEQTEIISQEGKSDLIRWQQDLSEDMENLAYQLTGWYKKDGTWVKDKDTVALCNDRFMQDVVKPQCTPFMSKSGINSNLSEERILIKLRATCDDIADNMADGYDMYGIEFRNYDNVLRFIKNTIQDGAFRAINGWTKNTDNTIMKRIESSVDRPQQQNKGIFGISR